MNISNSELKGKKIVIVEDDMLLCKYYETLLKNVGADFKTFRSGKEFVEYVNTENSNIDLVIMDFLVPFINGIECIRIFRKKSKTTPVIMITSYHSEQARTEAYLAGCNEYLIKPVYPENLHSLLKKYLNQNISVTHSS
jgi:DNA-binding response OmpR family regulator